MSLLHLRRTVQRLFITNKYRYSTEAGKKEKAPEEDVTAEKSLTHVTFESVEEKNRQTYLQLIQAFHTQSRYRKNYVEFITAALKNMKHYGVHQDLQVYKALSDVMPKGKFIPQNLIQSEFMHYPKQQQVQIDLLEQMEDNGVMPDVEMEAILVNTFGKRGHPVRKLRRMLYWMPKFKNLSPWPLPKPMPNDDLEIAKLAVQRIMTVDLQATVEVFETKDVENVLDETWIVSGQTPTQKELIKHYRNAKAIYIEGPFYIWLRNKCVNVETLEVPPAISSSMGIGVSRRKNDVGRVRSVHEQNDGTILAVCVTGTCSKDSLLSWIRILQNEGYDDLANIPILFKFQPTKRELVAQTSP
uniref:Evolutionarily conserved signaling intermediate in Toll pathway, mitochondrial n=1 Tax=Lutzomyia longipalpis TaxID=7200 RepID=A0A1B0CEG4_LUTLO